MDRFWIKSSSETICGWISLRKSWVTRRKCVSVKSSSMENIRGSMSLWKPSRKTIIGWTSATMRKAVTKPAIWCCWMTLMETESSITIPSIHTKWNFPPRRTIQNRWLPPQAYKCCIPRRNIRAKAFWTISSGTSAASSGDSIPRIWFPGSMITRRK